MEKSIKLYDKEVSALATKLRTKAIQARNSKITAGLKAKLPEAKKILALLASVPDEVKKQCFSYSLRNGGVSAETIAKMLATIPEVPDQKDFEADVILSVHGCATMAKLMTKLGL